MAKPPSSSLSPRDPLSEPRSKRLRAAALGVAVTLGLLALYSCSLIVETRDQQCQNDTDCQMFAMGSKCDPTMHVCLSVGSGSSSGSMSSSGTTTSTQTGCDVDGGIDAGGCYNTANPNCPADDNAQLLNACGAGCIPFANSTLKGINPDGTLPTLPPDGGGT